MGSLRVEELEPRQLLNGAWLPPPPLLHGTWFLPPPHADRLAAGVFSVRLVQRLPVIDVGGRAEVLDLSRRPEGGEEIGLRASFPPPEPGGRESEPRIHVTPVSPSMVVGWSEKTVSGPSWPRADHPEVAPNVAGRQGNIQTTSAGFQFAPPDWAAGAHRVHAAAAEVVPPIAPDPPLGDSPPSGDPVSENAIEASVRVGIGEEPPSPRVSGLLTALPPVNPAVLEHGIQRFLDQMDGLGQSLEESSGAGVYPWIAAVAAAAVACEIGRRHLKPPAPESIPEGNHLAIFPCDESLTE